MKKFMKAIAFATVMCLVLSTVAFAAAVVDEETKALNITVEGAAAGEQVAIIIVEAGAEEFTAETILYVDQKASKNFSTTITGVDAIDVYAGYATNTSGEAVLVAENVALEEEEEVLQLTITLANVTIVNDITEVKNEHGFVISKPDAETKGAVVKFTINVANAAGTDAIAGMAWVFEVKNDETQAIDTKYAAADATIVAAINSGLLAGNVEIAAAVNSTGYTITAAKALLSVNGSEVELAE